MRILITGGAGYIGSHVTQALQQAGFSDLWVLDNLSTGHRENVIDAPLVVDDIRNTDAVSALLKQHCIEAICHLAASTIIEASIADPIGYYDNNANGTLSLLKACQQNNISHFLYSSTAAIYAPSTIPLVETAHCAPSHPYGTSKWVGEQMVLDAAKASGFNAAILRYFNVAGASPCGRIGQRGIATHLIKNVVRTALNLQPCLPIYGTDYDTPDGTCIRDFIHVCDLATAHVSALQHLSTKPGNITLNCGYGKGYSVQEVVAAMERVSGKVLPTQALARRSGDLESVIADTSALLSTLNWQPSYADITRIVQTAYDFELAQH